MILVTGHRGFIGSHLAKALPEFIGIDVREGRNLLTCPLPDADIIYHFAAQSDVVPSWEDPLHDLDNIRLTARLVQRYPGARIIYANSAAAKNSTSPYGFSKWASAEYLKKFHSDYVICTLPNVYGPGSRSVVDKFRDKDTVTVFGDGFQTRSYVHVFDIVQAFLKAQDWAPGEYDLGNGIATSVLDLAKGKKILWGYEKKEDRDVVLRNTTPNWFPIISLC